MSKKNDSIGFRFLGEMHQFGKGTPQNYIEAIKLYTRSLQNCIGNKEYKQYVDSKIFDLYLSVEKLQEMLKPRVIERWNQQQRNELIKESVQWILMYYEEKIDQEQRDFAMNLFVNLFRVPLKIKTCVVHSKQSFFPYSPKQRR